MNQHSGQPAVRDGDPVPAEGISAALMAGELVYDDGATQTFEPSGDTTYVDAGRPSRGEWYAQDAGHFCSFWAPSYRACYKLSWLVEDDRIAGLRFTGIQDASTFVGRYRDAPTR